MKQSELDKIIEQHRYWLISNGRRGEQACLHQANLSRTNLLKNDTLKRFFVINLLLI